MEATTKTCTCHTEFGDITLNVHQEHYAICKACGCYWYVGTNMLSGWQHEDKSVWEENRRELSGEQAREIARGVIGHTYQQI